MFTAVLLELQKNDLDLLHEPKMKADADQRSNLMFFDHVFFLEDEQNQNKVQRYISEILNYNWDSSVIQLMTFSNSKQK